MSKRKTITVLILSILLISGPCYAREKEENAARWNQKGIDALNKNEYLDAIDYFQRALQILPKDETIKKNLAITYNNYAIALNEKNNSEDAKDYLYKAIELEKDNPDYKKNLANIISSLAEKYYKKGDYELSIRELKEALALLPNHTPSLTLLGQVYYQKQELAKAQEVWEKAYSLEPGNRELKQMLARLKDEKEVETQLKQLDAYYFDIRFDKEAISAEIYDIRYYLQRAYQDVGRDFNHYPQHKIPVILYTQEDFQKLRKTPEWVAGIYDGKIRLPVKNENVALKEFQRLIWHEYTHAVVFYLTDGKCPIWLNEGLAKYEEAKQEELDLLPLKRAIKENTLIPISQLNSSFSLHTNPEKLNLAYLESYSFVEFLLDRWRFYVIKGLLEHLKTGKSIEEAIYEETYRKMDKLEKDWLEWLQRKYCN